MTPEMRERILDRYIGGASLHRIAQEPGMVSYGTILRWLKENEEFRREFEASRAVRAIHFEEEARAAAESALTKDDVPAQRLKFDAYVWSAEVSDPAKYGKKTQVVGDATRPVVLQVITGVPEPLPHQMPPKLNAQGVVETTAVEVTEDDGKTPEDSH